jgi:Cytochrome P460
MRTRTIVLAAYVTGTAVALALFQAPLVRADDAAVTFPEGYRNWTFLHSSLVPAAFSAFSKSPCVKPCTNGIFDFYANELAMKGLRSGVYDDGAIIAEEMLEFMIGEKGTGGEGRRVLAAVMVKDSRRYAATGGWGFGNFDEGSKVNTLDASAQQACFQCHTARKDSGYVFSRYVER